MVLLGHNEDGAVGEDAQISEVKGRWVIRLRQDLSDNDLDNRNAQIDEGAEEELEEFVEWL